MKQRQMPQHRVDMHTKGEDVRKLVEDVRKQMQGHQFFGRVVSQAEDFAESHCKMSRATCEHNTECCSKRCAGHRCK